MQCSNGILKTKYLLTGGNEVISLMEKLDDVPTIWDDAT